MTDEKKPAYSYYGDVDVIENPPRRLQISWHPTPIVREEHRGKMLVLFKELVLAHTGLNWRTFKTELEVPDLDAGKMNLKITAENQRRKRENFRLWPNPGPPPSGIRLEKLDELLPTKKKVTLKPSPQAVAEGITGLLRNWSDLDWLLPPQDANRLGAVPLIAVKSSL